MSSKTARSSEPSPSAAAPCLVGRNIARPYFVGAGTLGEGNQPIWYVAYVVCADGPDWAVKFAAGEQEQETLTV